MPIPAWSMASKHPEHDTADSVTHINNIMQYSLASTEYYTAALVGSGGIFPAQYSAGPGQSLVAVVFLSDPSLHYASCWDLQGPCTFQRSSKICLGAPTLTSPNAVLLTRCVHGPQCTVRRQHCHASLCAAEVSRSCLSKAHLQT